MKTIALRFLSGLLAVAALWVIYGGVPPMDAKALGAIALLGISAAIFVHVGKREAKQKPRQ